MTVAEPSTASSRVQSRPREWRWRDMSSEQAMQSREPTRSQETLMIKLGEAVRKRRKSLGITQQVLARSAGCGLVFIYNLERGKATLRFDKILDILRALDLELTVSSRGTSAR